MKIEHKESLEKYLKDGITLFLGAGFSIYAKNRKKEKLPLGFELAKELIREFNCPDINDLSKICTIIDSTNSIGLKDFLINRFDVSEYESFYKFIIDINCKKIFTTNIDNLVYNIFEKTTSKYINNVFVNGLCHQDKNCIDYIPIHGDITMPDIKFLFNKQEVIGSFRTQHSSWIHLRNSATQLPSLFIGYSLEDIGAIESLFGGSENQNNQKEKWILLHKENPGNEAYFRALGFKILIGDTKDFLTYIGSLNLSKEKRKKLSGKDYIEKIYPEARVPRNNYKGRIRSIDEFYLGAHPIWSDVLSNRIPTTHHYDELINLANSGRSIIVSGIPASGKSTLMLQLAKRLNQSKRTLLFYNLHISKANIIKNEITIPTIIIVDNFSSYINAFGILSSNPKIQLIGFDRYYNIDISINRISTSNFEFYDVSDITLEDVQKIYNSIPRPIRNPKMITAQQKHDVPSIFEIVNYNINKPDIKERYKEVINDLDNSDPVLLDLFILTCFMHSCRVPMSFEIANAFLYEDINSYEEVLEIMDSLKGLVQETIGNSLGDLDEDQDYYQPRSQILAETVVTQTRNSLFKRVYNNFNYNVPKHLIPNFHVFRMRGYDAYYASKAYTNWREGVEFYEEIFHRDKSPFLLQQCSLYLLKKKRYTEAALQIDKALQMCRYKIFSIENTHAIVLFKANINAIGEEETIRGILDKSMSILIDCYEKDKRKIYHAVTFGEQAVQYFGKYPDSVANNYLVKAQKWLKEVQSERKYNRRVRNLLKKVEEIL